MQEHEGGSYRLVTLQYVLCSHQRTCILLNETRKFPGALQPIDVLARRPFDDGEDVVLGGDAGTDQGDGWVSCRQEPAFGVEADDGSVCLLGRDDESTCSKHRCGEGRCCPTRRVQVARDPTSRRQRQMQEAVGFRVGRQWVFFFFAGEARVVIGRVAESGQRQIARVPKRVSRRHSRWPFDWTTVVGTRFKLDAPTSMHEPQKLPCAQLSR